MTKTNKDALTTEDLGDFVSPETAGDKKPETEYEKLSGICLVDKHARLVWKRCKKEIAKLTDNSKFVGKRIYLCGKYVYGIITLNSPSAVDVEQFKRHRSRHLITDAERNSWWADSEKFFVYSFKINKMFKKPLKYKQASGDVEFISEVDIVSKKVPKKEEIEHIPVKSENSEPSKSDLTKYLNKFDILSTLKFSEEYKDLGYSILELYSLYLASMGDRFKGHILKYDEDGVVLKPEPDVTENYIRIRIRNPKTIVEGSFRTMTISDSQGIKAVIGKLKSDPSGPTKIQSVLFDKDKWTVDRARMWVKEHSDRLKNLMSEEFSLVFNDVIVEEKIEVKTIWICPHCKEEIGEKSLFYNETTKEWFHRSCKDKGPIVLPKSKDYKLLDKCNSCSEKIETDKDKDTGKQKEKWVYCLICENYFDYYKNIYNDLGSTILCPNCGALFTREEN